MLSYFKRKISTFVSHQAAEFWISPQIMSENIKRRLSESSLFSCYDKVVISGETDNISIYIVGGENIIIFTPFGRVQNNRIFVDTLPKVLISYSDNIWAVKKNSEIIDRLAFPKVILINLCVVDNFPSPRLSLSVASLAAYLRKYQIADVDIIDMQVGPKTETIIRDIRYRRPDIVGISINFGQLSLAELIIERIFEDVGILEKAPAIVAGNVVASFGQTMLLKKFPKLIICSGEGERAIMGLTKYVKGKCSLGDVPGITYVKDDQKIMNPLVEIEMDDAPLPSMDTLEGIIRNNGALTLELSRGCPHSACTFCPRVNRTARWKGVSPPIALKQLEYYDRVFDHFGITRRLFLADEDFIGSEQDGEEAKRIIEISEGIISKKLDISFETDTRVDQVYNPRKDERWHIDRMKMFALAKRAGVESLLIGVESGSASILERFNKKIQPADSIMACRILTSLGIDLKLTFITFDPLMNFRELKENVLFLERRDAFLKQEHQSETDFAYLFHKIHDSEFVWANSQNCPFYEKVPYMLVNLEILMKSAYCNELEKELLIAPEPDFNMARYRVRYKDETIGEIAMNCQKWIDRNFALDYCLKGMHKVATASERSTLVNLRTNYRKLCFLLLKSLVWIFDKENSISLQDNLPDLKDILGDLKKLKNDYQFGSNKRVEVIVSTLDLFRDKKMSILINEIERQIYNDAIEMGKNKLLAVIQQWKEKSGWILMNP